MRLTAKRTLSLIGVTLRDAHQCPRATRMATAAMADPRCPLDEREYGALGACDSARLMGGFVPPPSMCPENERNSPAGRCRPRRIGAGRTGAPWTGLWRPGLRRAGVPWIGLRRPGLWRTAVPWIELRRIGLRRPGLHRAGVSWTGLRRPGLWRTAVPWIELRRIGLRRPGLHRAGVSWTGLRRPGLWRTAVPWIELRRIELHRTGPSRIGSRRTGKAPDSSRRQSGPSMSPGGPSGSVPASAAVCRGAPWMLAGVLLLGSPGQAGGNGWEHGAVPFAALVSALDSESADIRAKAAESLGFRGEARGVAPLLDLLGRTEPSHRVRSVAYSALGRLADHRALPILRRCLHGEAREEIRAVCVTALGELRGPESLGLVLDAFRDDAHPLVRSRAVDALGAFPEPRSLRVLERLLGDGSSGALRRRAIAALGRTGAREAADALLARLPHTEGEAERAAIVEALARLRDPSAVDVLLREMDRARDPALRARVAIALGAIRAPSAYDALVRMLGDPLPAVRLYALRGLKELGRPRAADDVLRFYLEMARRLAGRPAADLVEDAPSVLVLLSLQVEALRALLALDPARGADAFLDGARSPEVPRDSQAALRVAEGFYERRRIALHGLGYSVSRDAAPLLRGSGGIGHPDPRLRAVAVHSLAVLGEAGVAADLTPMLRDPVPEVRWTTARALGRSGDPAAVEPLLALLTDEYGEVRRQAALALGYLGALRARGPLLRLADQDPVETVRAAAAYAAGLPGGAGASSD